MTTNDKSKCNSTRAYRTRRIADGRGGDRPAAGVLLALLGMSALVGTALSQPTDGVMVLRNLTVPMGGVWLANNAGGGHWWQTDSILGICRVDPLVGATPP